MLNCRENVIYWYLPKIILKKMFLNVKFLRMVSCRVEHTTIVACKKGEIYFRKMATCVEKLFERACVLHPCVGYYRSVQLKEVSEVTFPAHAANRVVFRFYKLVLFWRQTLKLTPRLSQMGQDRLNLLSFALRLLEQLVILFFDKKILLLLILIKLQNPF